jgi:ABC-type glycerol-3-phosphate transport system substrate-binding protein
MIERGLINSFREVEPRIEIQYAGGAPLSTGKLAEALGAGQAADAFGISLEEFGPLQAKNVLAETDYSAWGGNVKSARQVADLYVEGTVEPLIERESGRLLALPADVVNLCLLVHGRHVQEVGLEARRDTPRAWDDLLGFAQRLTRREAGVVIRRGFEFFYGPQGLATELGMATQLGGDFFAPDRRSTNLAAPPFVRALEFQHEYVFKHRLGDPTVRDPVQAFLHEQLSSVLAGPATVVALQKNNPALLETLHVAQIPMFKDSRRRSGSAWDGSLWAVSAAASAEVQAAAWRWLRHLSEAAPLYYEAFGMLHPHRELRAAPQFKELRPAGVQTPFGEVFLWDLRHGTVHLIHPDVEALRSIWQRAREMVLRDGLIPRDQLQRAKLEIDPILARSAPTP